MSDVVAVRFRSRWSRGEEGGAWVKFFTVPGWDESFSCFDLGPLGVKKYPCAWTQSIPGLRSKGSHLTYRLERLQLGTTVEHIIRCCTTNVGKPLLLPQMLLSGGCFISTTFCG